MKVLVIGNGGREHALVWSLAKSKRVNKIFCCPGNAGISEIAECVDISVNDFDALIDLAKFNWVECTIVGPEIPLANGIVDAFQREGLTIIGPQKKAAVIESSKVFSKEFMRRNKILTTNYKVFNYDVHAKEYIRLQGAPIVVKVDGLAGGKGVFVASTEPEANEAVDYILNEKGFGNAGEKIIVEDFIDGEEASFMVFTDGKSIVPMVSTQDHKRAYDYDKGPNTGGMGAYSPARIVTPEMETEIMERVMIPAIAGLKKEGIEYRGVLYAGLMIKDNKPYVLEFNCRFGDPEAQAILMRLDTDLLDIMLAIKEQNLHNIDIKWKEGASMCVVMSSKGYPGKYETGNPITGLDEIKASQHATVFHAGTTFKNSSIVNSSGRVLGVTAYGGSIRGARQRVYEAVEKIHFENQYFRKDIGHRALG